MAQFFKAKPKTTSLKRIDDCQVEQLDHHLHGIVRAGRQTYFVPNTLPGERVNIFPSHKSGPAKLIKRLKDSAQRISPICQFYQQCGGCSVQHLDAATQRQYKQRAVAQLISRLSGYPEMTALELLSGDDWHYRRVTRLSTWYDKSLGWQLGFRQKGSQQLVTISDCLVLSKNLSVLLEPLQALLKGWPKNVGLGHVELIDCEPKVVCRVRLTKPLAAKWQTQLLAIAERFNFAMLLTEAEQHTWLTGEQAYYTLHDQQLDLAFHPGDFIQVNVTINQLMINKALAWLKLKPQDVVLDLYSGIGNFSLPLAQRAKQVIAIEGVPAMSQRVMDNAKRNGLMNISAYCGDLEQPETAKFWQSRAVTKVLLDPARAGAKQAITQVAKLGLSTVVYVSCNPATLARDAKVLKEAGYKMVKLAVVDMFPQTEHIETMALFER
ncbi:23S rRNA (uracil(1939)-C(5))-methyltransferase RlmD [Agarivorans sp. QJM3NY_25]|uniref:23S rRNA (uracil(1939)-C(5))-methyltransferase RlmD n=1 Tax=Agarivorans sp. QJM3NY_25 TaxID=3421430 RepID=UPI003D7E3634